MTRHHTGTKVGSIVAVIAGLLGLPAPVVAAENSLTAESRSIGLTTNVSDADASSTSPGVVSTSSATLESGPGFVTSGFSRTRGFMRPGAMTFDVSAGMITASAGASALMFTDSQVTGYTIDSFVVTCPTCVAGTRGSLTLALQADARVDWTGGQIAGTSAGNYGGYSIWSSTLITHADGIQDGQGQDVYTQLFTRTEHQFDRGALTTTVTGSAAGLQTMTLDFLFGEPIHFVWNMTLGFSGGTGQALPHDATTWAALAMQVGPDDAYWNGITSVLDNNGLNVADYTAFNPGGVDFARSFAVVVPEPGTWALMAVGLGMLALIARRRRERREKHERRVRAPALRRLLVAFWGIAGLGLVGLAGTAQAQSFAVGYSYDLGAPGATGRSGQESGALSPGEVRRFNDAIGFSDAALSSDARVEGWGAARYGHLQSYAKGSTSLMAQGPDQGTYVRGDITVSLTDSFIIQCGGCAAGTSGSMSFRVYFDAATARNGGLGQSPTPTGGYLADTNWSTGFQIRAEGVPDPTPPDIPGPPNPGQKSLEYYRLDTLHNDVPGIEESPRVSAGLQELSIDFVFGEAIHLDMSLRAAVLGGVYTGENTTPFSGHGAMETDATRSMYWDGITSVFDAQGNAVNGFTALNAVGVDYARSFATAAAVPEPGTWALMAAGLALLGWRLRRHARSALTTALSVGAIAIPIAGAPMLAQAQAPKFLTSQTLTTSLAGQQLTQTREGSLRNVRVDGALSQMAQTADLAGSVQLSTWGRAGYGYAQAFAQGASQLSTTVPEQAAEAWGSSSAISRDSFVIDCDGCVAGTLGYFSARVYVDGVTHLAGGVDSPDALHAGYVDRGAGVSVEAEGVPWDTPPPDWPHGEPFPPNNPGRVFEGGQRMDILYNDYTETFGDASFGPGYRHMTVFFIFGQPIHLELHSSAGVMAVVSEQSQPSVDGWAMSTADLSRSTFWDGFDGVVDSNGVPLREFTALNAAGIDYRYSFAAAAAAAVPEPGTWALMALGLLAMGAWGRTARGRGRAPELCA